MAALDEWGTLAHDTHGQLEETGAAVSALDAARAAAERLELPFPPGVARNVAICGMGGSAIAGDLIASAYRERLRAPIATVRDYHLPGWVGEDTLAILASYSGNTEETLTSAMQATERAALCVGITSGGKLGAFYGAQGVPMVGVPEGIQPRAALIHMLVPMLVVLSRMGVLPPLDEELDEARATLERAVASYGPDAPRAENGAKLLAEALKGTVPLVYGAELTSAVARRWKTQLNENAKTPAFWSELPELDHNEIVGFESPDAFGPLAQIVMLGDPRQHRQVQRRLDLTAELVEPRVKGVLRVTAEGTGALARMLDLVLLGDYVSIYLACLRGLDPGPVEMIERLKERLATTGYGRA